MSSRSALPLRRACSIAAALALVACSPDGNGIRIAPTSPSLTATSVGLTLKGTLRTMQTAVVPVGPTTVTIHAVGAGTATHLGHYTIVSDATIDFASLTGTERLTLRAADGDLLYATVTAQATPNADGVTLGVVESATITGGTGRFAGATGSYVAHCISNQATGVSIGSFDGTITLDH